MNNLNLPPLKLPNLKAKPFSMDEYLAFVNFNLKYTVDIKEARRQKKAAFVNVPFSLK
ncbi:MAG: hypothetical protein AABY43_06630 [Candidatus Omnitrophota bacterium]